MVKTIFLCFIFSTVTLAQEITVWTPFTGTDLEWLQNQKSSFESLFGASVKITSLSLREIKSKILLGKSENEVVDVILPIAHNDIEAMVAQNLLVDMTSYATEEYLADLNEQTRLAFMLNSGLFGLPLYVEGPALIINTSLVTNPPSTFESFIETAKTLTNGSTYGFLYDISNFYFSYVWLSGYGGYVFARDSNGNLDPQNIGLATPEAIEGAKVLQDLRYKHGLIPAGIDYSTADQLFFENTLAMIYNGPWAIANYQAAGLNLTVRALPATKNGNSFKGFMSVQGVVINNFSKNKIYAANLAKWLTRPAAQISLAEHSSKIPSLQSVAAEIALKKPIVAEFSRALEKAIPIPNISTMGKVWGPMDKAMQTILESPDSDVSQTLKQATEKILE